MTMENSKKRPNIILIITDQQSASMMSCAGNKYVKTPNIDRLAAAGVRFERAYCTNPVCVPSRVSLVTGKMPSEFGMWYNQLPFEVDCSTQPSTMGMLMKNSGYKVSYGGKIHLPDALTPQNTGYDYFCDDECEGLAHACADYLQQDHHNPFFLVASFINPHDICYMALREFKDGERDERIVRNSVREVAALDKALQLPDGVGEEDFFADICPPLPGNHEIQVDEPEAISWLTGQRKFKKHAREHWGEKEWRMHRWAYAKLTVQLDKEVGILLEGLEKSGHQDNTVVIFTSDHGDHDSAHRLEHKSTLYDEAVKVPLVISSPDTKLPGVANKTHLISNGLDLLPTICDYAGVTIPPELKGLSIKSLAEGDTLDRWRNEVYIESEFGRAIVSQNYKYARYNGGVHHEQLYDCESDPFETRNSADLAENRQILEHHRQTMDQYIAQYVDTR
jgi:arylsulfatase A-like enzyme